jgi:4-oxalomesaconate hydratase
VSTSSKQAEPEDQGPVLVVSAHAADFVWRAGGFIASAAAAGREVTVVCLSFGERGESQGAWKREGATLESVKEVRRAESGAAADTLGASIIFLDKGDYPLPSDDAIIDELVDVMRSVHPSVILTHSAKDPYNTDHELAAALTIKARMVAQAEGLKTEQPPIGAPPVYRFEPHQTEMCEFFPDVLLDITDVFATKRRAMECMQAQEHLVDYYTQVGQRRGVQAVRNGGVKSIVYAEAYQRVFPRVAGTF